ncbi:MAG: glycine cleavage system aminomethyltransferase GcvT [Alphaproteobacteria bacterium]|nr:glycine cleavage system aminomethyltransferase GcvT [Alphaproteobacteria bacterium SS10]
MAATAEQTEVLNETALHARHVALGGKMVPFAGWSMPVQYPAGIMTEHRQVRESAGLFDVSHMGQVMLRAADGESLSKALERLVPGDVLNLKPGRIRYSVLLNEQGGAIDDLMITRDPDEPEALFLVINAARVDADLPYLRAQLDGVTIEPLTDRALLAVQGPKAAACLSRFAPSLETAPFMSMQRVEIEGIPVWASRCGYTGEDGFELSVANDQAVALMDLLLAQDEVEPIGLGARDSLRLEAGLCLYGHDMDESTSPVEANVAFAISKRRREEGGFLGSDRILAELADGPKRQRVGIQPEGRAPVREGALIKHAETGEEIGVVTSGGFGPTVERPVAMGIVSAGSTEPGTKLTLVQRGREMPAAVAPMPFVPARFYRGPKS